MKRVPADALCHGRAEQHEHSTSSLSTIVARRPRPGGAIRMVYQQRTPLSEPLARARHGMLVARPSEGSATLLAAHAAVHQNYIHVSGCRAAALSARRRARGGSRVLAATST
jgi:hypothetical protein